MKRLFTLALAFGLAACSQQAMLNWNTHEHQVMASECGTGHGVLSVDDETAKAALGPPLGLITWLAMPGIVVGEAMYTAMADSCCVDVETCADGTTIRMCRKGDFFYYEGRHACDSDAANATAAQPPN